MKILNPNQLSVSRLAHLGWDLGGQPAVRKGDSGLKGKGAPTYVEAILWIKWIFIAASLQGLLWFSLGFLHWT